ncbi:MAG: class I SAM-dependent methyltransferase [Patescibacteria group bacterium]
MSTNQEHLQKISQFYDSETSEYDNGYSSLTCKAEDAVVADILRQFISGRILDIGAGSGLLCEMMGGNDYVGIELSPRMTVQEKTKFLNKDFMVADMHSLPFADSSFDSAVSLYGPLSYSLAPEELLKEVMRVVCPGGYIVLMPYTLRVGHNLEIGGYSTAIEKGIEKIFYTANMLQELLSPLEGVQVFGINYFLNTYTRFVRAMNLGDGQSLELFIEFLQREHELREILPAEYARHIIGIGHKPTR